MRGKAAIVVLLLVALRPSALAEPVLGTPVEQMPTPHLYLRSGSGVLHFNERLIYLPLGTHILTEERWQEQEDEKIRLQEQEIRLTAENKSFRNSADEVPWRIIALGVAVGLITGTYIGLKF